MITLAEDAERFLVEKMLFTTIEKLNLPRKEVNLKEICDNEQNKAFGLPGDDLRRSLQERWFNIKRTHIRSYNNFLLRMRIQPSQATKIELESCTLPSPVSTVATNSTSASTAQPGRKEGAKPDKSDGKEAKDGDALMASFKNLSISQNQRTHASSSSSSSPTPQIKMFQTTVQQPIPATVNQNANGSHQTPQKESLFRGAFGSPARSVASEAPSLDNSSISSLWTECTYLRAGATMLNPIPIPGDISKGEAEAFFPFNINRPAMKDDPTGKSRVKTVTVKRVVEPGDLNDYNMWLKTSQTGEQYLLTQEPSQAGVFHEIAAMFASETDSDQAMVALENKRKIESDANRKYIFRAIEVRGFKLDNKIFSSDGNNGLVKKEFKLVPHSRNGFPVKSTVIEWNIALQGNAMEKFQVDEQADMYAQFQALYNTGA